tara:strand:- start:373 stop:633 length:261 start_codon:yes stop_codon:yes gene_type:complete
MIPKFILTKVVIPLIEKTCFKLFDNQAKVWKLKENNDYREKPNELDRGLDKVKVEQEMQKSQMKDMADELNKIKIILQKAKKIRSL